MAASPPPVDLTKLPETSTDRAATAAIFAANEALDAIRARVERAGSDAIANASIALILLGAEREIAKQIVNAAALG